MIEGPRAARPDEIDAIVKLSDSVFRSGGGGSMGDQYPTLFCAENSENLRIYLDDGAPISLVGFTVRDIEVMGSFIRVCNIGSVCTNPDYRGRGYATELMRDSINKSLQQGVELMLISGGRGLYRRMGCIDAGIYYTYQITRGIGLPKLKLSVDQWRKKDIAEMVAVHQSEQVRYVRDADEFLKLLSCRMLVNRPSDTWNIRMDGELVAYICAQKPADDGNQKVLRVKEIAGSRSAIISALPKLFDHYDVDRIDIDTYGADLEMSCLGKILNLPIVQRGFGGTMIIINLPGFFSAIEDYISERLTEEENSRLEMDFDPDLTFVYEGEEFSLGTPQEIAAFIFGSIEMERPVPETPGLSKVLNKLFPIPLVYYGLNYI